MDAGHTPQRTARHTKIKLGPSRPGGKLTTYAGTGVAYAQTTWRPLASKRTAVDETYGTHLISTEKSGRYPSLIDPPRPRLNPRGPTGYARTGTTLARREGSQTDYSGGRRPLRALHVALITMRVDAKGGRTGVRPTVRRVIHTATRTRTAGRDRMDRFNASAAPACGQGIGRPIVDEHRPSERALSPPRGCRWGRARAAR